MAVSQFDLLPHNDIHLDLAVLTRVVRSELKAKFELFCDALSNSELNRCSVLSRFCSISRIREAVNRYSSNASSYDAV